MSQSHRDNATRHRRLGGVDLGQPGQPRVSVGVGHEQVDGVATKLIVRIHYTGPVEQRGPEQPVLGLHRPTLKQPRDKEVCSSATRPHQSIKTLDSRHGLIASGDKRPHGLRTRKPNRGQLAAHQATRVFELNGGLHRLLSGGLSNARQQAAGRSAGACRKRRPPRRAHAAKGSHPPRLCPFVGGGWYVHIGCKPITIAQNGPDQRHQSRGRIVSNEQ